MSLMLTWFHTRAVLDPNATGESQLALNPYLVSEPQYQFPFDVTPMLLSSEPVTSCSVQEVGPPSLILPPDLAPKFEGLFITADNFSYGTPPIALNPGILASESAHLFVGQIGPLQEYRHDLIGKANLLVRDLQTIEATGMELQGCWPDAFIGPIAQPVSFFSNQPNFCVPSVQGPFALTQYFHIVRDELFAWICKTKIALRGALTAFDLLLGCVTHSVLEICKANHSNVRLFCNVCWEKRRWFQYHGARPPKAAVQAILGLFAGACSGSRLVS